MQSPFGCTILYALIASHACSAMTLLGDLDQMLTSERSGDCGIQTAAGVCKPFNICSEEIGRQSPTTLVGAETYHGPVTRSVDIVEKMRIGEMVDVFGLGQVDFVRPVLTVTLSTAGKVVGKYGATTNLEPATEDAS